MNVLMLSNQDLVGGAYVAAYRLHTALSAVGVQSVMAVRSKKSSDDSVLTLGSSGRGKVADLARHFLDRMPMKLYPNRTGTPFSAAWVPDGIAPNSLLANIDLVHLHWVCAGCVRVETLRRLHKPIVWTMHDMWPFTGGCHYSGGCNRYELECGACPQLSSSRRHDLSHWVWTRKRNSWKGLDMTVVAPSRWLAGCASNSGLFRRSRVLTIPYGLDTDRFRPVDKHVARDLLCLPRDKQLILFAAMGGTSDERKGYRYLLKAFEYLSTVDLPGEPELAIIGAQEPKTTSSGHIPAHYLGHMHDDVTLALCYSAADVFVAPSIEDNLPNTLLESLACGVPVVAFDVGGMPDLVKHQVSGYLARPFEAADLANGIAWVLGDATRHSKLSQAAREKALAEYSAGIQARRYLELYEEIIRRSEHQ